MCKHKPLVVILLLHSRICIHWAVKNEKISHILRHLVMALFKYGMKKE